MKHWYKYIKPYLAYFIIGHVCMIVEVLGEVLMPKLLGYIIDSGVRGEEITSPVVRRLYDMFGSNYTFVIAVMVGMIITAVLMMLGGVGGAYFGAKASVNFASDLRSSDDLFLPMLSLGAAGIISVSANLFPRAVKEIYLSWVGGDTEKARRLFLKLQPLNCALFREISPSPVKYALCRLGLCTDEVRLPLCHVTHETEKIIDALLPEYTE